MLIITSIMFSVLFIFLYHPLSLGFTLLVQTILVSLITGTLSNNYWFSYILFLIMIGGMLILFIYMTSISSNKKFKFSINLLIMSMIFFVIFIISLTVDCYYLNFIMNNMNTMNLNYSTNLCMSKFMNYPNNYILFTLYIYLFITLIAVSKISNISEGPLRQKF
uniref:NADH-ubiquinone oxidoreductase chain 6 n=1 Tax=Cucujoidea sp. 31 KM-2017 TaxID=2219369 RepID=A0A346RG09_9CUCU|nr:NADH dehydrogenase subunit 6 [Cucujoidea sp. 31 KM-2017]